MWITFCVTGWLLVSSAMDIRTRRLPVWMLVLGGIMAAAAIWNRQIRYFDILGGMAPGMFLLLTAFATKKAGYGDGIALSCLGAALGGERGLLLFGLSLFLMSVCSLILLGLRKVGRNTGIPYLPFLTAAWILVMRI